jgi:hypothetical protein
MIKMIIKRAIAQIPEFAANYQQLLPNIQLNGIRLAFHLTGREDDLIIIP